MSITQLIHYGFIVTYIVLLGACEQSAPKKVASTSTPITQVYNKTNSKNLSPISLNSENFNAVASSTLKAVLLSDFSTTAVDTNVAIIREQNQQIVDMATGVVITMLPVKCLYDGDVGVAASLTSTGQNIQINFDETLAMTFNTSFSHCNQGYMALNGVLDIEFNAALNQLLTMQNYNITSQVKVNQLAITFSGFLPFVINGQLNYQVESQDGITIYTDIYAQDLYYAADTSYQTLEFQSHKWVNSQTGEYQINMVSKFVDFTLNDTLIEYETLKPLQGVGYSVPVSGVIKVNGGSDNLIIDILDGTSVKLLLDYGADNIIDEVQYTTWYDLALRQLSVDAL